MQLQNDSNLIHRGDISNVIKALVLSTVAMNKVAAEDSYNAGYVAGRLDALNEIATATGIEMTWQPLTLQRESR